MVKIGRMKYNPTLHHRRSIRLKEYDYSLPGAYFVTLVTKDRTNLFGDICGEQMIINSLGEIICSAWANLPGFFNIQLDESTIMPNHLHGIIWILVSGRGEAFAGGSLLSVLASTADASPQHRAMGTKPNSLSAIIQNFKSVSTRRIHQFIRKGEAYEEQIPGAMQVLASNASPRPIWQRDYFERVIRNERELDAIRAYIIDNPRRWTEYKDYHA